ncbi:hypothetical protein FHX42_000538 [Saccharopolyspora lacisalsi]|uniref:DUF3515 domain-containing protein n=1 Tax=Halosaccharopolyspora lacisalsi TaxID=1000566 RepID=A0A839DR47_9PSEU|nr:DUF3515 domain-containing protein [Halosaccharopolyspora lacisalsi]MBA8823209.1 hypothetical protein [Halosaccharopolyspora lacisalsi]
MGDQSEPKAPRVVLIVAVTLGVLLAAGVATIGLIGQHREAQRDRAAAAKQAEQQARRSGPLAVPPVRAPEAGSRECATVLAALPPELSIHDDPVPRRELARPAPEATVAWGDAEHDPVTLRCGLRAPRELTPTSHLTAVSGVEWLAIRQGGRTTWLAADRPVHIALTVSQQVGTGPIQEVSKVIARTLPKQDVFP